MAVDDQKRGEVLPQVRAALRVELQARIFQEIQLRSEEAAGLRSQG